MRRSTDLVHWEFLGTVFTAPPAWVVTALGATPADFWAPDLRYFNGKYHLYYAASQFATNNSVIGLATTRTLDPGSPDYGWVDEGMVMRSRTGEDDFNAIDPDVSYDERGGRGWPSAPSGRASRCAGWTRRRASCRPRTRALPAGLAARRPGRGAVDRAPRRLLLLVRELRLLLPRRRQRLPGDGRALRAVTGPYVDRDGVAMTAGGGTELLRGYNEFAGPGHGDVFRVAASTGSSITTTTATTAAAEAVGAADRLERRLAVLGDPLSGNRGAGHGAAYSRSSAPQRRGARQHGLRIRGRGHPPRDGSRQPVPAVAAGGAGRRLVEPEQPAQQQGRRGGGVQRRTRAPRGTVGLAGERVPAVPLPAAGDGYVRIESEHSGRVLARRDAVARAPTCGFGTGSGAPVRSSGSSPPATC